MFEFGAIVVYLAEMSEDLSSKDAAGRACVATWVLAGLNSIEPHTQNYVSLHAYHTHCELRPAFQRALEAQLSTYRDHAPTSHLP